LTNPVPGVIIDKLSGEAGTKAEKRAAKRLYHRSFWKGRRPRKKLKKTWKKGLTNESRCG